MTTSHENHTNDVSRAVNGTGAVNTAGTGDMTPDAGTRDTAPGGSLIQKLFGLLFGIGFGFLLQRGGVADYDVIIGQLLLKDFTVVKVMLSAVITGLFLVNFLFDRRMADPQPKSGGWGLTIPGALIFGAGFAVLGYCPGTLAAAVGHGSVDALVAGLPGILVGAWLFAVAYPFLNRTILSAGVWHKTTLPELLNAPRWLVIVTMAFLMTLVLLLLEITM